MAKPCGGLIQGSKATPRIGTSTVVGCTGIQTPVVRTSAAAAGKGGGDGNGAGLPGGALGMATAAGKRKLLSSVPTVK